ncbi:hypothetical protein Pint_03576 [Pistacia integerrima]|uniref:Uncharacterized protein n=1 Tax=Pistacia integerrima TaxID=434235 RepID=A0ACC0ZG64_9ROSI|nr:hypothetical protein Pint_03576 [Pistacia integerrima]
MVWNLFPSYSMDEDLGDKGREAEHQSTPFVIEGNDELMVLPNGMFLNLTGLRELRIEDFSKPKVLPTDLKNLKSLDSLCIRESHELESLPEGLQGLISLRYLGIDYCKNFKCLSDGFRNLTALEKLVLCGCPKLVEMPGGFQHLVSLKCLNLIGEPAHRNLFSQYFFCCFTGGLASYPLSSRFAYIKFS